MSSRMIGDYYAKPFPSGATYARVMGTEIAEGDIVQIPVVGWRSVAETTPVRAGGVLVICSDGTEYVVRYGWDLVVQTPA